MLIIVSMVLFAANAIAAPEEEPNDTLLDPQMITGEMTGSVVPDTDIDNFALDVPDKSVLLVAFEKVDSNISTIHLDTYNTYRKSIYKPSFSLTVPGESDGDHLNVPSGEGGRYYFSIWGNGSYALRTKIVPNMQVEDEVGYYNSTDIGLEEVSGSVRIVRWEGLEVSDKDSYSVTYNNFGDLKLTLRKTDSEPGKIKMHVDYDWGEEEELTVDLDDPEGSVTLSYPLEVTITIEGDGNYTLGVEEPSLFGEEVTWVLLGMMCMIGFMILLFIIAIAVIVIVIVKSTKTEEPNDHDLSNR